MRRRDFPVIMSGPTNAPASPADPIGDALRADCVAYWKMDESNGTRVDASGHGNDLLEVNGTIGSAAGKVGNSSDFYTINGEIPQRRLRIANNSYLTMMGGDYYISFWLKVTTAIASQFFVMRFDDSGEEFSVELSASNNGKLDVSLGNNGYIVADTFGAIEPNIWYFVEAYYKFSNDSYGIAINNGSFDVGTDPQLYETNVAFTVGQQDRNDPPMLGYIDELRIGKKILSQDERDYLYNSGAGRTLYP